VESPRSIPAPPDNTYREIEFCLKAKGEVDVPEGHYSFKLPSGINADVKLIYNHPRAAFVSTLSPTEIGATTATGRGEITGLGLRHPVKHGVCWSTTEEPDITCHKTGGGEVTETGRFAHPIMGLAPGTTYYVRAFATNSAGPAYGKQVSFTTLFVPDLEEPRVVACNIAENAWGVPLNITPQVVFSEPMDPGSLTAAAFSLTVGAIQVAARHVYNEATLGGPASRLTPFFPTVSSPTALNMWKRGGVWRCRCGFPHVCPEALVSTR